MISYHKLIRILEHERCRMRKEELASEFLQGMLQGLTLALALTESLWLKTKDERHPNPMGIR